MKKFIILLLLAGCSTGVDIYPKEGKIVPHHGEECFLLDKTPVPCEEIKVEK